MRRIEDASLRAWPALESEALDGWELRASDGFSKRANSVQPFGPSSRPLAEKVVACESWYDARRLPTVFRMTPFSDAGLDGLLAERGYRRIEPTQVSSRDLALPQSVPDGLELVALDLDPWLSTYGTLSGTSEDSLSRLRAILDGCPERQLFGAVVAPPGPDPCACGLAVLDDGLVGLFDVVTVDRLRRRGFGTALVSHLLAWGRAEGAASAYLQVVESNTAALALYQKLGFRSRYSYWYRIRSETSPGESGDGSHSVMRRVAGDPSVAPLMSRHARAQVIRSASHPRGRCTR